MDVVVLSAGGEVVCGSCSTADTPIQRMKGLLGRRSLPPGEGLLLRPAGSVHTAFMRFPIDVVFLDRGLRVIKTSPHLPPWRMSAAAGAKVVLELPAGECARQGIAAGMQLSASELGGRSERAGWSRRAAIMAAGVLALLALARFGLGGEGLIAAFFAAVLGLVSVIDLERRVIPNRVVLPAAAVMLVLQTALFPAQALECLLGALGAAGALMALALVRPGGIGMGDVKLGLLLGATLGRDVIPALALGFVASWPVAIWLVLRHGRDGLKRWIAFGPLLSLGALVVLFAGGGPG